MANYNLTNQTISSSFSQLLQKDTDTEKLVDGVGTPIVDLTISGSTTSDFFIGDGSQLTNTIPPGTISGSSQVTLEDTTFTDGIQFQVLRTDGAGNLSFDFADRTQIEVRATEAIAKGDPLYVVGFNVGQNRVEVAKADASNSSHMPAYGLAYEAVSINTNTQMVSIGTLDDIDTQVTYDFQVGDTVYVAAGGGLTNVKPTGTNLIQNVGVVGRRNQTNGEIVVSAIGRSNDLPNIQDGYLWVGDSNGVPQAVATSSIVTDIDTGSLATTGSNTFDGNQVVSGSVTIQDTNAPMSGLVLKNNSGGGDVQIIPGGDFITTFNEATLTGIETYGGSTLSGSWGEVGKNVGGGAGAGVYNADTGGSIASAIKLVHGTSYKTFESSPNGNTRIKGETIQLQPSSSAGTSVQVTGDVSASNFTGSFTGDGSSLSNLTLPSGLVSGSSQVIINDVNGFTAYSQSVDTRLDTAEVEINSLQIVTGSYATTGSNIFSGSQTITGSLVIGRQGFLDERLTVTDNADIGSYLTVGKGLFVTQSNISSLGSIVLSYPFTGSNGSVGQVTQNFDDFGSGTTFKQAITGVDFSEFTAQDGGIIFSTINSGEVKFFSAGNMQMNAPTTFVNSNLSVDIPAGGTEAAIRVNPNYDSTGKGFRTRYRPNSGDGRADMNLGGLQRSEFYMAASSGSFGADPNAYISDTRTRVDGTGWTIADLSTATFQRQDWLNVPYNNSSIPSKPNFKRGLEVTGASLSNIQTITTGGGSAVIDMNAASLFEVTLDAGSVTTFDASNVNVGQTVRVLVNQNATTLGTVTLDSKFKQPDGSPYVATTTLGAQDMLTLTCYNDTNSIYVTHENKFV